jgi:hypothetical protein
MPPSDPSPDPGHTPGPPAGREEEGEDPARSSPDPEDTAEAARPPSRWARLRAFWARHRVLFWTLHSLWALATGVVVIWLARERYGFVPWVVAFLAATWASTLFFGRAVPADGADGGDGGDGGEAADATDSRASEAPPLRHEVTSYLTRTLYQETLFFLLPFYAYSTVVRSPNVVFPAVLVGLAILSCLDLVFDRWLRRSPVFGVLFFAVVAFAALNLLLPMVGGIPPRVGTPLAAALAVGSALPLVLRHASLDSGAQLRAGTAGAVLLAVAILLPSLVPPVPLRMETSTFATDIDRESLELGGRFDGTAPVGRVGDRLVVLVEVFAPSSLPARVRLEWRREGELVRTSREVEIVAHGTGFRVWDGLRVEGGSVPPGRYVVVLETARGRIFGRTVFTVTEG